MTTWPPVPKATSLHSATMLPWHTLSLLCRLYHVKLPLSNFSYYLSKQTKFLGSYFLWTWCKGIGYRDEKIFRKLPHSVLLFAVHTLQNDISYNYLFHNCLLGINILLKHRLLFIIFELRIHFPLLFSIIYPLVNKKISTVNIFLL